jgi:hypothetical protein
MTTSSLPLFYQRPRPLRADADKAISLASVPSFSFAANANVVPVIAAEMAVACRFFPILFTSTPIPQPVTLLGLRTGDNLFVDADGKWASGFYIPAYIRRYPFIFMENADKSEYTLCIDEAASMVVKGRKNPVFDKDGAPTEVTKSALAFCRDYQAHHTFTAQFIDALVKADLLVDHRADVTLASGEKIGLTGFKIIDETKFNALPDAEFLRWRAQGWINPVVCHFISTGNWQTLVDRTALRMAN